jgi:RNA polymerase sigma-70 factor (ECF subfamily)
MSEMSPQPDSERHEQFVSLFVHHQGAIYSFIQSLLPALSDPEDVMQETSMTLWRRFDQFEPGTSFRNWAFQVAKFTVMGYRKKMARDRHRFSSELMDMLASDLAIMNERLESERRALNYCVEKLTDEDQDLLAACYSKGSTVRSFASETGRSPNTLYKRLNRIRTDLLGCVQRSLGIEGVLG